jgi:hypothetical protein
MSPFKEFVKYANRQNHPEESIEAKLKKKPVSNKVKSTKLHKNTKI